jgi:hypothetical protein
MRNTIDITSGKFIAVLSQFISAINPLVAFYDIHGNHLPRIPHETKHET